MSTDALVRTPEAAAQHRKRQRAYWNGDAATTWVEQEEILDTMLSPFNHLLLEEAARVKPRRILDVGCGFGTTTLALAKQLGEAGQVTGIDLSQTLINHAKQRIEGAAVKPQFICDDAGAHDFGEPSFDLLVSRFGVMFFADPVTAFANLMRAAKPGASLAFVVWRPPEENEFLSLGPTMAAERLAQLSIEMPGADISDPGPFSLSKVDRTEQLFETAGWEDVRCEPHDLPGKLSADMLERYLAKFASMRQDLSDVDPAELASINADILAAYQKFVDGDDVPFTASVWLVRARKPG
ncbi:MAG: class I SAM-dependent methyltransferase [Alphaproteobacteria bacterium]|nr:class I SAM-dependent methyltransferase [Alphaproteobacteria bacterium SS10]